MEPQFNFDLYVNELFLHFLFTQLLSKRRRGTTSFQNEGFCLDPKCATRPTGHWSLQRRTGQN